MSPHTGTPHSCSASELLLLVSLLVLWLGVTVMLGSLSLLVWAGTLGMALIASSAPSAAAYAGVGDRRIVRRGDLVRGRRGRGVGRGSVRAANSLAAGFAWTFLAELTGFYLGFIWVLVVLLIRHIEQLTGRFDKSRPLA